MKTKIISIALSLVVLMACKRGDKLSALAGKYVNNTTGNYSVANDTLVIKVSEGHRFTVDRKTGFNLIRNGKKGKREHETEKWNTIWDETGGVLKETRWGKIITFYPDSGMLVIGKRKYIKVN